MDELNFDQNYKTKLHNKKVNKRKLILMKAAADNPGIYPVDAMQKEGVIISNFVPSKANPLTQSAKISNRSKQRPGTSKAEDNKSGKIEFRITSAEPNRPIEALMKEHIQRKAIYSTLNLVSNSKLSSNILDELPEFKLLSPQIDNSTEIATNHVIDVKRLSVTHGGSHLESRITRHDQLSVPDQ